MTKLRALLSNILLRHLSTSVTSENVFLILKSVDGKMAKTLKMGDAPPSASSSDSSSPSSGDDELNNNSINIHMDEDIDLMALAQADIDNFDMTFAPGANPRTNGVHPNPNLTFNPAGTC